MSNEPINSLSMTRKRLDAVLGVFNLVRKKKDDPKESVQVSILTDNELVSLRRSVSPNVHGSLAALRNKIRTTTDKISEIVTKNETYMDMLPEADKAADIIVTSTMSPIDMYGNKLTVVVDTKLVPDELTRNALQTMLIEYVNTTLGIGEKLRIWIRLAMFKLGAVSALVVPRGVLTIMVDSQVDADGNTVAATKDGVTTGLEDFSDNTATALDITPNLSGIDVSFEALSELQGDEYHIDKIKATKQSGVAGIVQDLTKSLEGCLGISLDISKIRTASEALRASKKKILEKTEVAGLGTLVKQVGQTKTLVIPNADPSEKLEGEPIITRLPTSSVFPVIIPGSPEEKLGYFIVIDKYGNPLNADIADTPCSTASTSSFVEVYSNQVSAGTINVRGEAQAESASRIFDVVLQNILSSSAGEFDMSNFSVSNYSAMSRLVFSRVLKKEKINLIFVPAESLMYLAYDFRDDGTGKTVTESVSTLAALRTTTLVAKVVSILTNATDITKIGYSMPNASMSNVEQMNSALTKTFVNQYGISPSPNAMDVMNNIYSTSVRVAPTELEELKNFTIDKETSQRRMSRMDTELEEMLTKMLVQKFGVPMAAIDEMHERDFSRSVATTNIMFSNKIRDIQSVTCNEVNKLVRVALRSSKSTVDAIIDILHKSPTKPTGEGVYSLVTSILDTVVVTLPAPNVSPDTARLTAISDQINNVETIVNALWDENIIVNEEDRQLRGTHLAMRTMIKQQLIRDIVDASGSISLANIPSMTDFDPTKLLKSNQTVANFKELLTKMSEAFKNADADSGGGGYGY